jgi:hypothetical protein
MQEIVQQNSEPMSVPAGGEQSCFARILDTSNPHTTHDLANVFPSVSPTLNDPSREFASFWQPELSGSRPSTDFGSMSWVFDVAASDPSSIFPTNILD